jgi:hypothetical protein
MPTRDEAIAAWEQSVAEARRTLTGLDASQLARPTPNPGWDVRALAAHIATADDFVPFCAKKLAAGKNVLPIPIPAFIEDFIGRIGNKSTVKRHRVADAAALVAALDASHAKAKVAIEAIPEAGWTRPGKVPGAGRQTLATFIQAQASHANEHLEVLRQALT